MKPLYKFRLNTTTGKVEVTEITQYEEGNWMNRRPYIRYKSKGQIQYCYLDSLDRYKSKQVYSFNPDICNAMTIIATELRNRKDKAFNDYTLYNSLLEILHD